MRTPGGADLGGCLIGGAFHVAVEGLSGGALNGTSPSLIPSWGLFSTPDDDEEPPSASIDSNICHLHFLFVFIFMVASIISTLQCCKLCPFPLLPASAVRLELLDAVRPAVASACPLLSTLLSVLLVPPRFGPWYLLEELRHLVVSLGLSIATFHALLACLLLPCRAVPMAGSSMKTTLNLPASPSATPSWFGPDPFSVDNAIVHSCRMYEHTSDYHASLVMKLVLL